MDGPVSQEEREEKNQSENGGGGRRKEYLKKHRFKEVDWASPAEKGPSKGRRGVCDDLHAR